MKATQFVLFLFILIASYLPSHSLNYYHRAINYSDGLSHLEVKAIYQDSYGFMWFGTKNKLNRFDGVTMRTFDCYDKIKNKRDNNINAILESTDNTLWLGTDNGVFTFDMEKEIFHFFDYRTDDGINIGQWVADIHVDKDQNIWIVVPNQGVFRFETNSNKLSLYKVVDDFRIGSNQPECMTIDEKGNIWIGTNGSGIYLFDKTQNTFKQFLGNNGLESLANKNIYSIASHDNFLIVGVHDECLMLLDPSVNRVRTIHIPPIDHSIIRQLVVYDSKLWIATQAGLYSIFVRNGYFDYNSLMSYKLSDQYINYIYEDKEKGVWVGSRFGGISLLPNHGDIFEVFAPSYQNIPNVSNRLKEMVEDDKGNIWMGTEDSGLLKFDISKGIFTKIETPKGHKRVLSLMKRDNELWVGYFKGGLDVISLKNGTTRHYDMTDLGISEESVFVLLEDREGDIWLGDGWGVHILRKGESRFKKMDIFNSCYTYDIFQDREGYIWIVTLGNGIFQYNPNNEHLRNFIVKTGEGLTTNLINGVSEDHKGQLWFSTDRGGICVYNKQTDKFKAYSIENGLPDDIIYKIFEDQNYNLWFGTNKGLVCFNPENEEIKVYTDKDGLPSNSFNYNSGLISKNGKIYMSTMEGLVAFRPDNFQKNDFIPSIYITELLVSGEAVGPNSVNFRTEKNIQTLNKIALPYNHSNVSIGFAALSYTSPNSNKYAYMLEGTDKSWIYTKNNHTASYANLQPGTYIFKVKGTNNDGLWSNEEKTLTIEILPPWWRSNVAYIIYSILLGIACYIGISLSMKRYNKKNENRQRLFETKKEKELYEAKINFFTEIAHEIRTPVTLISGPLESVMREDIKNEKIAYNLNIIQKNTNLLLSLINQLLDFRKVDSDKFIVNVTNINFVELIDSILSRFGETIKSKGIICTINKGEIGNIFVKADKEALDKIIGNILSNAVKYTHSLIDISLNRDNEYIKISISNDGELIPETYRDKIFNPFFRVKSSKSDISGSGLGLSLARSLTEMLNGYLYYDTENDRNNFYLKIPEKANGFVFDEYEVEEQPETKDEEESTSSAILHSLLENQEQKKSILVVEDNLDMLHFIENELNSFFDVETAENGEEAISILGDKNISIVISDVMMPSVNGFDLCSYIKNDPKKQHIIVILLTARNDVDSKIHALNIGADAYVEKPFSIRHIITLIDSLERNRQITIDNYIKNPSFGIQQNALSKTDLLFLEKVIDLINSNIADPNFNVEKLAELLNYSRSSLHRRIKAITDSAPTDFIRTIRLHRAVELIKQGEHRINEICYLVGINSPSYFVKIFQTQYNMTPKEYKDSL